MGGTEAFPDLGRHCQHSDCHQLDFLPFNCNRCQRVFCVEHRTYKSHDCPKPDDKNRKVIVCETCSKSIETTGLSCEEEAVMMENHTKSKECNPSKKQQLRCPVNRCKENLTFSNAVVCRSCSTKVCLKHRLTADHACSRGYSSVSAVADNGGAGNKLLAALTARNGKDCAKNSSGKASTTSSSRQVKAC